MTRTRGEVERTGSGRGRGKLRSASRVSAWTCDRITWSPRGAPSAPVFAAPRAVSTRAQRSAAVLDTGKVGSMASVPAASAVFAAPRAVSTRAPRSAAVLDTGKLVRWRACLPRARCRLLYGLLLPGRVGHRQQLLGFADVAGGGDGSVEGERTSQLFFRLIRLSLLEQLLGCAFARLRLQCDKAKVALQVGQSFEVAS